MRYCQPIREDPLQISANQKAERGAGTNQQIFCWKEKDRAASGLIGSQLVSACVRLVSSLQQAVDMLFPTQGDH